MAPRLVVLGWDSATFDVTDPLIEAGRLPALAALASGGFRAPLRSTWPPMTDCAWTSAFTGVNPGTHGIFGSWYRAPGAYECRYFSGRDRRAPAIWEMTSGVRWLVWNVPMTFPPERVEGVMVAGYGAPPGSRFCEPASFQESLASRWQLDAILDKAPHGSLERYLDELIVGLGAQADVLPWAIRESGADCVVAVWPHVDRAQHFFWGFRGTDHPLATAVERVYEAMDRATGRIVEGFPDADVLVVSDHGAGTLHGDVNVGAWLADGGYARYGAARRSALAGVAWRMPPGLRRLGRRVAPETARRAIGASVSSQLGPFDWAKTKAFVGVHGDLWLNLEGREPSGTVTEASAPELLDEIADGILSIQDPESGAAAFAAVHRRDEIYSGAAVALAPDMILDSWSAGYRVAPRREPADAVVVTPAPLPGVDAAWSADHRPLGIFVGAGPRIGHGTANELSLYDVCPTALALLEQEIPGGLDGRAAERALTADFLDAHPIRSGAAPGGRDAATEYSAEEAAAVEGHLKDLGYIE